MKEFDIEAVVELVEKRVIEKLMSRENPQVFSPMKRKPEDIKFHDNKKAADFLGFSLTTLCTIRQNKEIKYYQTKRKILYRLSDLIEFKNSEAFKKYKHLRVTIGDYSHKQRLTGPEVQDMLNISYSSLRELRDEGALPYLKVQGKGILYRMADVLEYIEKGYMAPPDTSRVTIHRKRQLKRQAQKQLQTN